MSKKHQFVRFHPTGESVEIPGSFQTSAFAFFVLFVAKLIAEFGMIRASASCSGTRRRPKSGGKKWHGTSFRLGMNHQ
jgi:hypothetical protein